MIDLPLHPSQAWFLDAMLPRLLDPRSWSMYRVLRLPPGTTADLARAGAELVWRRHEALRATFSRREQTWRQRILDGAAPLPFRMMDLSRLDAEDRREALTVIAAHAEGAIDINRGPVVQFVYLAANAGDAPQLLVVVHHLVCDAWSLRLLVSDLGAAISRLQAGSAPSTTSRAPYRDCVRAIHEYGNSPALLDELPYWTAQPWDDLAELPNRSRDQDGLLLRPWTRATAVVEPEITSAIVDSAPTRLGMSAEQLNLAVVADALTSWAAGALCFRLLKHGRDLTCGADGPDLFPPHVRLTVGWFATGALAIIAPRGQLDRAAYARRVVEWTTAAPNQGVGINLLRWLAPAGAHSPVVNRMWAKSALLFNYVGTIRGELRAPSVTMVHPQSRLPMHVRLEIAANTLYVILDYDPGALSRDSMSHLADLLHDTYTQYVKDLLE